MRAMIFNAAFPSYYYVIFTIVIHYRFRMRSSTVNFYVKKNFISLNEKKFAYV
jgi:hypothetical protein